MKPRKSMLKEYIVIFGILYLFIIFFAAHWTRVMDEMGGAFTLSSLISGNVNVDGEASSADLIGSLAATMEEVFSKPFYFDGFNPAHIVAPLLILTTVYAFALWWQYLRAKVTRSASEDWAKGNNHWNMDVKGFNKKMAAKYDASDEAKGLANPNIIIAGSLQMSMEGFKTRRNLNVLVIGGSGTGKSRFLIKPNILQMNCSFVVTDPSGENMADTAVALSENGYDIKVFSTSDMAHSNVYNPFDYVYDENGEVDETKVAVMTSTFLKNANSSKKGGGDPFWDNAAKAFLTFAVMYFLEFHPKEEQNMYNVLKLTQAGKSEEEASSSKTELDYIVARARRRKPDAKCFVSYDTFKLAPSKTADSILISLGVYLEPFGTADKVRNMTTTSYVCKRDKNGYIKEYVRDKNGNVIRDSNNLDLGTIGDRKTALFINIPQANAAYNFLVSMMYAQMFEALYTKAEKVCGNRYHIYDKVGACISSQYVSEDAAKRAIELYSNAEIRIEGKDEDIEEAERIAQEINNYNSDKKNKKKDKKAPPMASSKVSYYLYNKDATKEESIPEKAYLRGKNNGAGYLMKVYSRQAGEQMIERYKHATIKKGRAALPCHVRCLLDEFANIGEIPEFNSKLATMRKYEISCTIVLQSLAQIKEKYDKLWESMIGNCDTVIFLGSSENETDKYIAERLGKTTIRIQNQSESKGKSGSYSTSYSLSDRDLMQAAEIAKMDNEDCIIMIRGFDPFYIKKYEYTDHPNYYLTGDKDKSRLIDGAYLEQYFKCTEKKTNIKSNAQNMVEKDRQIIEEEKEPSGVRQKLVTSEKPMKDAKEFANAVGAKDATPKAVEQAVYSTEPEDHIPTDDMALQLDEINIEAPVQNNSSASDNDGPAAQGDAWLFEE